MKKVAVVLAGCGVYDGAEINEVVLTLLSLEQQGATYQCYAPNIDQMHVINHLTGEEMAETRNVMIEAARITRGNVMELAQANVADYDALIVPGGFGAAKNLSDFAIKGSALTVQEDFLKLAQGFYQSGKPVGLICIAPTMAAKIFGAGVECTVGNDAEVAEAIEATGGKHLECPVNEVIIDQKNKLVTTPAYMLAGSISEAAIGISECVKQVIAMA
ncbi:isoprenoid biosynthesis glyoxalase ElbB [Oceanicoccus sp. KOV_DT_Chl]|uniref:isoprenoid biosynthesis glyoxalase ElbB n=1 Tax=Oceanicoccus sp. KOV_DT_Chl TaxID=1904639 RepID=UPI000C7E689E|nr:isoprenoid biosynthesis glyoxalase ElbB [Oceanicoccus sp. KOV_DT_Chl]